MADSTRSKHDDDASAAAAIKGVLRLLRGAITGTTTRVQEMHAAIARRPFRALDAAPGVGAAARVVEGVHNGIAAVVYESVRLASTLLLGAAEAVPETVAALPPGDTRPKTSARDAGTLRDAAISAVNGAIGDHLENDRNPLAIEMAFRHHGRALALEAENLRRAHARLSDRVCIFVHGLGCNEQAWDFFAESAWGKPDVSYGSRLQERCGYTPFYVRYNTGRHISENGRELAQLIEQLVAAYPVRLQEIALIGHSMGGLVSRSACHYGREHAMQWTEHVRHVVCLGAPHLGAPLEKIANVAAALLALHDITAPLARVINGRSVGVKDLRFGYVVDDDWQERDPDAMLDDGRNNVPFLPQAHYYFVGASLAKDVDHPAANIVGDMLVTVPSASGRHHNPERSLPFDPQHGLLLGGLHHLELLNHPDVYGQIERWLGGAAKLP